MAKTVNGRERVWQIQALVGSGDAGEVLRVFSQPGSLQGVMKRPVQNVSGGTIVRQAGQIETEGKILAALEGIDFTRNSLTVHTPRLLDRSVEGTSNTVNLFIVSEEIQGKSISTLLAERLSTGQPIPQNVVLKVLSSLLLLLEKVHSKGVVWNDVKMDHIFWSPDTKTMSFIDWGNGLFFQPQPVLENSPVWQDYTQMVEEGLNLLNQTSPNLIHDLGWPLHPSQIKSEDIPQLRMRVEYLETYLTMRAIEYELLFERFTNSLTDLDALRQALELNQELHQFGITTDLSFLRAAAQELLFKLLSDQEFEQIDQMLNLVETSLKDKMSPQWQLAGYLLKLKAVIPSHDLSELLKEVLDCDWVDAIWLARGMLERGEVTKELASSIYSMRNMYLDSSSTPTIYADMQIFLGQLQDQLTYLQTSSPNSTELLNTLTNLEAKVQDITSHWSILSPTEVLGNQLFNLRQVLGEATAIRLKLPTGLSDRLQRALATTRDIYQSWNAADIDGSLKALKKLYTLEPTLDYLLPLADSLSRMKKNVDDFETGPESDQSVNSFAIELLARADDLPKHLGTPDWLGNYNSALQEMSGAINLENLQDLARHHDWPTQWVYQPGLKLDVPYDHLAQTLLSEQQKAVLVSFHSQILNSSSRAEQLVNLRRLLPATYASYKELDEEFQFIFSGIPREPYNPELQNFPAQDTDNVSRALRVLSQAEQWKNAAETGDWFLMESLSEGFESGWALLDDLRSAAKVWTSEVLPALTDIKQRKWKSIRYKQLPKPKLPVLSEAQGHLYTFICEWQKIEVQGLYPELLNELVYQSDAAQNFFFNAWQQLLRSDSRATVWLSQNQQSIFSEINQVLLTLYRYLRALQRNFEVINQPEMARTRLAQNAAGDLVFLLIKIDEMINPTRNASPVFKRWQRQYLDLLAVADSNKIRQGIQEIEGIHPLLPWFDELVRRDAGYFEQSVSQQW